ncbi:MAG: hypothetical protein HY897_22985 [Deltaproteobacteria bacterium]|nr:hypothetical protein [Deltaproteobacteria bacterium]
MKDVCLDKKVDVSMWRKNDPGPTLASLGPKAPLELDAVDPERRVAYVYVSAIDSRIWDYLESSVQNYFTKDLAEHVSQVLSSGCGLNVGVFYDPLTKVRPPVGDARKPGPKDWSAGNQSAADLRAQVRDFIAWARREGMIK